MNQRSVFLFRLLFGSINKERRSSEVEDVNQEAEVVPSSSNNRDKTHKTLTVSKMSQSAVERNTSTLTSVEI